MIPGLSPQVNEFYLDNPVAYSQDFLELKGSPLYPYSYQQSVLNKLPSMEPDLENQLRILLVLGARQIFGKSITASIIGAWYAPLHDYSNVLIISHRMRRSTKMLSNMKNYFKHKAVLKSMTRMGGHSDLKWSSDEIELSNESNISSLPEGNDADSAVGEATSVVLIDEVGKFKNADSIKAAIMPTIFETNGVIIMLCSSWGRVGKGQFWYEVVQESRDCGSKNLIEMDAIQCLDVQKERWIATHGIERAEFLLKKKMDFLTDQKKMLGLHLYNMQYMNSFETGLENVFEPEDLKKCFKKTVSIVDAQEGRKYITVVDYGKSVKTGDETVISTYDITKVTKDIDESEIDCVYRRSYSINYKDVIPKIEERVLRFKSPLYCDIGGGEMQLEVLNDNMNIKRLGIKPVGMIASGSMKTQTTKDFVDKGITRKTFNKYECVLRLQAYIQRHNINYGRACDIKNYEEYVEITTPSGSKSFNHPPDGHDDDIDTDIMLMAVLSEQENTVGPYSASVVDTYNSPTGIIIANPNTFYM